jgi:hypothetical protein
MPRHNTIKATHPKAHGFLVSCIKNHRKSGHLNWAGVNQTNQYKPIYKPI